MTNPTVVQSQEIIEMVSTHPNGILLGQLVRTAARRYGASAKFQTGSLMGMDIEDLLVFLEARDKLRIIDGVVFPCSTPAYAH